MLDKKVSAVSFLIIGIFLVFIGNAIIINNITTLTNLILFTGIILVIKGIINILFNVIKKDKKNISNIPKCIIDITFGIIFICSKYFVLITLSRIFGIYLLFISITHLVNYYLYFKFNIKGRLLVGLKFIITFILSISILLNPKMNIKYLSIILGIYLILYGINSITNFLSEVIPPSYKDKIKRSINIQLPIFMTAFIPMKLLNLINENLEVKEIERKFNSSKLENNTSLQVLIHLSPNGSAKFGHVDISYNNLIFSYGNYDMHSRILFDAIGDGVILIADKEKYIKYCTEKKDRFIIEFGIALTKYEEKIVKERIDSLLNENTMDYYSDLQLYEMGIIEKKAFNDMSSEIYKFADGRYKKITHGKHKKFFVLKNNCVMVAQYILSSVGKEILAINGIISPGAYYEYLNKRFNMKNTNVVSRKIYLKGNN